MLEVRDLHVRIDSDRGMVKAVNGVSFNIKPGETIGVVGESGSGKSVLAQSLIRLNPESNTYYPQGDIVFENKHLLQLEEKKMRNIRGKDIAMIFQDPMSSLNPVFKIGDQLMEAIRTQQKMSRKLAKARAIELLNDVGIPDPFRRMQEYPHQFSGGMRQRVLIAIALASKPKLLIADEPTTALDVTIQAQIIHLLKKIQKKYNMAIMMITHDLGVVANIADKVLVMYAGKIVESGTVEDIFYHTKMPYTWSLLQSLPRIDQEHEQELYHIKGQAPQLVGQMTGCSFYPRCPFATEQCNTTVPELKEVGEGHYVACILSENEFMQHTENDQQRNQNEVAL